MGTLNHNVQRYGLTEVYTPIPSTSILVDVVFVHGLNGDPHSTWTSTPSNVFWPADLLPQFVEDQKARVLVYGYDADVTSLASGGTTKDKIHNHSERLVADLFANRRIRKATERPIVFVAHSLGGLVVKRALIYSSDITGVKTEHLRSIFVSAYGILFLGTPHKGSDIASWGSFLEWLCKAVPKKALDTSDQLVEALKANSETLQNIDRQFSQMIENFHLYFFHEAKPTDFKTTLRFIVEEESAAPTLPDVERAGIQADHSHMCKFENENSPGFDLVVDGIQRYAEDAPTTITARWTSEREERMTNKIRKAKEMFSGNPDSLTIMQTPPSVHGSTPSSSIHDLCDTDSNHKPDSPRSVTNFQVLPNKPGEPYFIVPPGFRANTFFVGMTKELGLIDKRLFDKKRRCAGTACALIYGQAGSGKSHLARQYVNKNRRRFPGGIFWLHAWSFEELWKDYWQIAQKVVAKDSPELRVSGVDTGREFVEVVKEWFEGRREWLMVLDGVNADTDEDINKLQRFIPNSRDSSLIYVSRAKRLETLERLLRPQAIKVGPLRDDDACELLFRSIPIANPRDAQKKSAKELVKKVGGLPLAINAISYRIAYTHEPLEKYTIRSYSEDEKIGGRYHEIMDDMRNRGHMAAFNLANILCFFGPHIPVEMVRLGLRALKYENIEVKSVEKGLKGDINISFGILMRYGLLERNEPDDRDSMSSNTSSLVVADPIDMLKMHMVIQMFCCDSLNTTKLLPTFLTYAIRLFCHSFAQADRVIKSRPEHGRVSDYREYLVHGQRLRSQTLQYESRTQLLRKLRTELDPTLLLIKTEIQHREPSSSQESIQKAAEFQTSIFDRTSGSGTSSRLSLSGARTPDYIPLPSALIDENEYGIPLYKPSSDSPRSVDSATPVYELFEGTWRERTASDMCGNSPWQTISSRRSGYSRRDCERSPARTHLNRESATGSVIRLQREPLGLTSGSSDAVLSLTRMHHASPPPSRGYLWSRSSSSRSPARTFSQPTDAAMVAGQSRTSSSPQSQTQAPPLHSVRNSNVSTTTERGWIRGGISTQSPSAPQQSSRRSDLISGLPEHSFHHYQLEEEFKRTDSKLSRTLAGFNNTRGPVQLTSSFHPYSTSQMENTHPRYAHSRGYGRNPNPLPLDRNITLISGRPAAEFVQSHSHGSSGPVTNPNIFPYHHETQQIFHGYRSQPLSRDHSHQSQISAATEPSPEHPTSISPYLNSTAMESDSLRMRNPDGSPPHKSPKLEYHQPTQSSLHDRESPGVMVRSEPSLLSGTGGWAAPMTREDQRRAYHFSDPRSDYSHTVALVGPTDLTGSGPGMAIEGLGIAEFGHEVVFGDFESTSVSEARRRLREWESRLKERERQLGARIGDSTVALAELSSAGGLEKDERNGFDSGVDRSITDSGIHGHSETPYPEFNRIATG